MRGADGLSTKLGLQVLGEPAFHDSEQRAVILQHVGGAASGLVKAENPHILAGKGQFLHFIWGAIYKFSQVDCAKLRERAGFNDFVGSIFLHPSVNIIEN